MKAKIEISSAQIEVAIEEYFQKRKLNPTPCSVRFKAIEHRNAMDQPVGGHIISATVEVDIGDPVAH